MMPIIRRGFSNQIIYVSACNKYTATGTLDSAYAIIALPSEILLQSASIPYLSLGLNRYRFNLDTLNPGQCVNFTIATQVTLSSTIGQTLCIEANLYPADSCVFDTIPDPYLDTTVTPCLLPWDKSSLRVEGACTSSDSIRFVIYNTGALGGGDMDCWAPVRIYIDGVLTIVDSIRLNGGDSIVYTFAGDGRTWRLEADQHPLHPGHSRPNASVEACGTGSWTPGLISILPDDDADPVVDIFCGLVSGSYDPNDKTGYPLGVGTENIIRVGQQLEYVIRFQNVGTDTAFNVVIMDTLDPNLAIFSVTPCVTSHASTFRMHGPRVLEWTFNHIMLPDSNVDEPNSHGFVKFLVDQDPDLPLGAVIHNDAAIYFDLSEPVITNTTTHTIGTFDIPVGSQPLPSGMDFINVFPNPTNGEVNVHGLKGRNEISVINMVGQQVHSVVTMTEEFAFDLSHLSPGIYTIRIRNEGTTAFRKVVIQ